MRLVGVIPARYGSTRFPGKPLVPIAGRPLLHWVIDRCRQAAGLAEVVVATDDERIRESVRSLCRVEMTREDHPSGTDRIAEVAARVPADGYVNIQGDEPLIEPGVIDAVAGLLGDFEMTTAAAPLRQAVDLDNPNVVKAVRALDRSALYFSRLPIPGLRDHADAAPAVRAAAFPYLRHLGIYGYRTDTLGRIVRWPVSALEAAEKLEQLRAIEHGIRIGVAEVDHEGVGVDTPADIPRAEALLRAAGLA